MELWSRRDPVTLFGAIGMSESGWEKLSHTFPWVASRFPMLAMTALVTCAMAMARRARSKSARRWALLFALPLITAVGAAPASATFPGKDGRIAFDGVVPGTCCSEIFTAKPNGGDARRLTSTPDPSDSELPDWSPDGERIAFDTRTEFDAAQIYVMNADGSGLTQLTMGPGVQRAAGWSPDADSLAIAADWGGGEALQGIWIIPASDPDGVTQEEARRVTTLRRSTVGIDGSGLERLTRWRLNASDPDWSPDGQRITFDSGDSGRPGTKGNIYVMRADGSGRTRLTDRAPVRKLEGDPNIKGVNNPVWSPSGTQIMYTRNLRHIRPNRGNALVAMNPDGSDKHVVVGDASADAISRTRSTGGRTPRRTAGAIDMRNRGTPMRRLVVLPAVAGMTLLGLLGVSGCGDDSDTSPARNGPIAFSGDKGSGREIYTINPDGTGLRRLTHLNGEAYAADWSPDGTRIAFLLEDKALYIMNADGSDLHKVTGPGEPAFTPDGDHLVYRCQDCPGTGVGIFLMRDDGSDAPGRRLSTNPFPPEADHSPQVSPDGQTVTFVRRKVDSKLQALFAVDIDGGDLPRLTTYRLELGIKAAWAPDGRHIVLTAHADYPCAPDAARCVHKSPNVATVRPDGSHLRMLTHYTGGEKGAISGSYSPDGRWILFRVENLKRERFRLYKMHSHGTHRKLIRRLPFAPSFSDWGPQP
jgi:Tol biopolymer transport system component